MRIRQFVTVVMVCASASAACLTTAFAAEQIGTAPLQLKTFMKSPVSSSATRTVKKADGNYTNIQGKRLRKTDVTQRTEPAPAPIEMSSEATNAYASIMDTRVKVVAETDVNEIDLAADIEPIVPIAVSTSTEKVQVVAEGQINAIDEAADKETAAIAPRTTSALSDPIAISSEGKSWIRRMLDGLNTAIASATNVVKALFA